MSEAAPQAAGDDEYVRNALDALDVLAMLYEDDGYVFGHDAGRGFWAAGENGDPGHVIAAPSAGELVREIGAPAPAAAGGL